MMKRGSQDGYNKLLNDFNCKNKTPMECVRYLIERGYSYEQAKNAVHVYLKGGDTKASFILWKDKRNHLLDEFHAIKKIPKECVDYLRNHGCTYRQANSAVYKYRKERGLIGK